jgi:lantibiotic biosynthesis protein
LGTFPDRSPGRFATIGLIVFPERRHDTRWQPLLHDAEAKRVWSAIHDVAEALRLEVEEVRPDSDPSLNDGTAGLALFFAHLGVATGEEVWSEYAQRLIEQAIDALANQPLNAWLHGGFAGVGWTIKHLEGLLFDESDDDDPISELLSEMLEHPVARGDFDLIKGLTGFGVYALEALPRPAARRLIEQVIERLADIGEPAGGGFSWFTPPEMLPAWQLEHAPDGYFNLGVAHGVPGVISLLAACTAAGVLPRERRPMLEGAVDWLLRQKQTGGAWSFPVWVAEGLDRSPTRPAWCYGDPGVAAALLTAARHTQSSAWEAEALEIARRAVTRPMDESRVIEACLCHGAAGLGHVFNRMHQATGDPLLAEAARRWFLHALDLRRPGEGVAGFLSYASEDPDEPKWAATTGFLVGASGVALALLAAVTPQEPAWDRALAISVPLERLPSV